MALALRAPAREVLLTEHHAITMVPGAGPAVRVEAHPLAAATADQAVLLLGEFDDTPLVAATTADGCTVCAIAAPSESSTITVAVLEQSRAWRRAAAQPRPLPLNCAGRP